MTDAIVALDCDIKNSTSGKGREQGFYVPSRLVHGPCTVVDRKGNFVLLHVKGAIPSKIIRSTSSGLKAASELLVVKSKNTDGTSRTAPDSMRYDTAAVDDVASAHMGVHHIYIHCKRITTLQNPINNLDEHKTNRLPFQLIRGHVVAIGMLISLVMISAMPTYALEMRARHARVASIRPVMKAHLVDWASLFWLGLTIIYNVKTDPHQDDKDKSPACITTLGNQQGGQLAFTDHDFGVKIEPGDITVLAGAFVRHHICLSEGLRISLTWFNPWMGFEEDNKMEPRLSALSALLPDLQTSTRLC